MSKRQRKPVQQLQDEFTDEQISQFAIPAIQIVQGMSRMEGRQGNEGRIYHTGTRQFYDEVHLLIVDSFPSAALRQTGFNENAPYMCKSPDGVAPFPQYIGTDLEKFEDRANDRPGIVGVIPDWCVLCPFYQTRNGCNNRLTYRAIDVNTLRAVSFLIERTRWDAAKQVNTELLSASILDQEYPAGS